MRQLKKAHGISAFLNRLSIRSRLYILVTAVLLAVVALSAVLLFQQQEMAQRAAVIAVQAHHTAMEASQLRESFAEIERYAAIDRMNPQSIERFRRTIRDLDSSLAKFGAGASPTSDRVARAEKLAELEQKFEAYISSLDEANDSTLVQANGEELSRAINSLIVITEDAVFHKAEQIRSDQQKDAEWTFLFLSFGIFVGLLMAIKMISMIVRPLSSLANFVDQIRVEDDIPSGTSLPAKTEMREIASLRSSFERLLQRLRGYRTLNVRRLLIEKRQADIISASTTDGIFLLRDDEIMYLNPVAERILGLSRSNHASANPITSPAARIAGKQSLRSLIERDMRRSESEGDSRQAAAIRRASGARAVVEAISRAMPVDLTVTMDDRKLTYLITATPISYDLVEQIEHSVGTSVDQVLDRFQANTLVVARDVSIVRESQEAKSHFLGTLSHEVKTPVTSLTMATRLLKKSIDQIPNPMHRSLISTCADDVDRLRRLLEELLTVSRFDTLAQRLEIQEVDAVKMVRHAVQSFMGQAAERGVGLTFKNHIESGPISIAMDATKITWAISNLLTNALRHTPRTGNVEVSISSSKTEEIEVKIRDTGPGIDRGRQERIFDKFNPFYDLRVARSGGAGVGLAIAREIVVAHGGRIWVASEPGLGAEFCFTLPVRVSGNSEKTNELKGAASGASARS